VPTPRDPTFRRTKNLVTSRIESALGITTQELSFDERIERRWVLAVESDLFVVPG
jgi:hypothetical protein